MCGICGVVGGEPERERASVARMLGALEHRGPDDVGVYQDDGAVLGNRRLAIIDPSSAGRQPLGTDDGELWLTYNGEIYNYREARRELERGGHRFRTRTDTEVVLELYRRHGRECLRQLRGMFAFVVWDRRRRRLFAARDHFGQKPLYFTVVNGRFVFASEIKALLAHGDVVAEPEPAAVDYYLSLRFVPPPLTMFRNIHKLAAGHWLVWSERGLTIQEYWRPVLAEDRGRTEADWIAELPDRIEAAVADHLVSDVPVGAFLSGGLDSSVVVSAMCRHAPERVQTFCVGSDGWEVDDRPAARLMAAHCGTRHYERSVSASLVDRIPWLVRCLDEPSDPIAACVEAVAQLAATRVKVAVGGDGGDEVFAGFDRYAAFDRVARLTALPGWLRRNVLAPALRTIPESNRYKSGSQRARWLASVITDRGGRLYGRMTAHFRFGDEDKRWLYGASLRGLLSGQDALEAIARPFDEARDATSLDRMIFADVLTRLPEHTLLLADRMGMAHGLEIRSPLLDVRLAEFCFRMPAHLRIRGGVTKYALRRAVGDWLPRPLLRRSKQGFMFPVARWLSGSSLTRASAMLERGHLVKEGWIERSAVARIVREHAAGRTDHHVRIWMLLNLETWYRLYLRRDRVGYPVTVREQAEVA